MNAASRWAHLAAAVGFLLLSSLYLAAALDLPHRTSRGDVGPAEFPILIAFGAIGLSVLYAVQAARGQQTPVEGEPSMRPAAFIALFVAAILAIPLLGLAIALAVAVALGVVLLDGPKGMLRAVLTGAGAWALAALVFGWLLGLPLP